MTWFVLDYNFGLCTWSVVTVSNQLLEPATGKLPTQLDENIKACPLYRTYVCLDRPLILCENANVSPLFHIQAMHIPGKTFRY